MYYKLDGLVFEVLLNDVNLQMKPCITGNEHPFSSFDIESNFSVSTTSNNDNVQVK